MNTGWKLALVVNKSSPGSLLVTYHVERHPVAARVRRDTTAQLALLTLLHAARPVPLNLDEPGGSDITPWTDRVRLIEATCAGTWEPPVLGQVAALAAVLIGPDGYVAWVEDGADTGLRGALTTWLVSP